MTTKNADFLQFILSFLATTTESHFAVFKRKDYSRDYSPNKVDDREGRACLGSAVKC